MLLLFLAAAFAQDARNLNEVPADLVVPPLSEGTPVPGARVRRTLPGFEGNHHVLHLPLDWIPGRTYPVFVEFAGNGGYRNALGDLSDGTPEGSRLGFGAGGGRGWIWVCVPFVDRAGKRNAATWWGDAGATAEYLRRATAEVCSDWGGDSKRLVLGGFSRGAIAVGYIGLRDDETARPWRAFVAHSHFDGVRRWGHPEDDPNSARRRLGRLAGRPVWVSHEESVDPARRFLEGVNGALTFESLPFPNHTDAWALRDLPIRRRFRDWLARSVLDPPK